MPLLFNSKVSLVVTQVEKVLAILELRSREIDYLCGSETLFLQEGNGLFGRDKLQLYRDVNNLI